MNIFYLITFIFLTSIVKFTLNFKFFLNNLICLEFMVLLLFFWQSQIFSVQNFEKMFMMIFITFSVCEGVVGISILILMIRLFNSNLMQSLNVLKC